MEKKAVTFHRCKRCGSLLETGRYCDICRPIIDKKRNRERQRRYRERHGNNRTKRWMSEHLEQKRLHSRNWIHRHPEQHKQSVKNWRKKNPEKVRQQNRRARLQLKKRGKKNLYDQGIRIKIKTFIRCPRCGHGFKTSAKRPQCRCNYSFPRDYFSRFINEIKTTPCKCCGRLVPYQGRGRPRRYCECCLPQINALKSFFAGECLRKREPDYCERWRRKNAEIIVALTCRACGNIVLYKGTGRPPQKCGLCRCIERSRPRPLPEPENVEDFIRFERHRLGLDRNKKWSKKDIHKLETQLNNWGPTPAAATNEEDPIDMFN